MIDVQTETLVSLSEAAASLPRRRAGKKPHTATLYRWTTRGCKGIVLESLAIGGTRCTSREALQRFFERLSGLPSGCSQPKPRNESVERELDRAGI